jgi:hypothetical protein
MAFADAAQMLRASPRAGTDPKTLVSAFLLYLRVQGRPVMPKTTICSFTTHAQLALATPERSRHPSDTSRGRKEDTKT